MNILVLHSFLPSCQASLSSPDWPQVPPGSQQAATERSQAHNYLGFSMQSSKSLENRYTSLWDEKEGVEGGLGVLVGGSSSSGKYSGCGGSQGPFEACQTFPYHIDSSPEVSSPSST